MSQITTLAAIGLRQGTDKASTHHNYLEFYKTFFAPLRHKKISILEIGVFGGASLRTWEEYFTDATIVGADISPSAKLFESDRVVIELLDQSNIEELTRVAVKHGPFDIIIEDGSHMWESLRTLFPFVKDGGLYIVEDLQTNYGSMQDNYKGVASFSCMEYLKSLVDLRVGDDQIPIEKVEDPFLRTYERNVHFMTFYRRACLIKKQFPLITREISAGSPLIEGPASGQTVAVSVTAHLGYKGDVRGNHGFVNLGSDQFSIQKFMLVSDVKVLEYRVLGHGDSIWSEWHESGEFAGTRGQYKVLVGFAVRVKSDFTDRYILRAFGRLAGLWNQLKSQTDRIAYLRPADHCVAYRSNSPNARQILDRTAGQADVPQHMQPYEKVPGLLTAMPRRLPRLRRGQRRVLFR